MLYNTYQLAENLHTTVARLEAEMPMPEFVNWHGFLRYREGKQRQQAAKDKARSQVRSRHGRR